MNHTIEISSALIFFGAIQGFLLSIYILSRYKKRTANLLLGGLLFLLSFNLLCVELSTNFFYDFPIVLALADPILFLYGPLIFFYTSFLSGAATRFEKRDLLHLISFMICLAYFLPLITLSNTEKIKAYQTYASQGIPLEMYWIWIAACLHNAAYLFVSVALLGDYHKKIKSTFSNIDKINLRWLVYILTGNFIIWLIDLLSIVSSMMRLDVAILHKLSHSLGYLSTIFIYAIGYIALKMPQVISGTLSTDLAYAKKYHRSGLTYLKAEEYKQQLAELMENESPYLNPDLALNDLCEALSVPSNYLSQVLNEKFSQNFFDFVNSYRVEEAKQWLTHPKKREATMLAIAFESGFKSKSTFNSAFKKQTGLTPSQFKKTHSQLKSA